MMRFLSLTLIKAYQWLVSPWLAPSCRFYPSCSDYAQQAITRHGAIKGGYLTARRLLRCHPWGGQGLDPVPDTERHAR